VLGFSRQANKSKLIYRILFIVTIFLAFLLLRIGFIEVPQKRFLISTTIDTFAFSPPNVSHQQSFSDLAAKRERILI
jgi:hypothetical protein